MTHMVRSDKASNAFSFSAIAGILILSNAVILGIVAKWFVRIMPTLPGSSGNDPTLLIELATVGFILGVLVLLCTLILHNKPVNRKAWGTMIIVFSIPSVIMGGGFIIGFILGITGGISAIRQKPIDIAIQPKKRGGNRNNIQQQRAYLRNGKSQQ
jgi:hypothetical protein